MNTATNNILKKISFVADNFQKFGKIDWSKYIFKINSLLHKSRDLQFALKVLNIHCEVFTPQSLAIPSEINISFGTQVNLEIIYYIVYTVREILGNNSFIVYINYSSKPEEIEKTVLIGSYITKEKNYTNVSQSIMPNYVLCLHTDFLNNIDFLKNFPNINYNSSGKFYPTIPFIGSEDDYDDFNYYEYSDNFGPYNLELVSNSLPAFDYNYDDNIDDKKIVTYIDGNYIEILKKISFVYDTIYDYESLNLSSYYFKINSLLDKIEYIEYVLNILNISYETYAPTSLKSPDGLIVDIDYRVSKDVIFLITSIIKVIYKDDDYIDIYINYSTKPEKNRNRILLGAYISREEVFTNKSSPIELDEILSLNINILTADEFISFFPNEVYNANGFCELVPTIKYNDVDYDEYDDDSYGRSYRKYGGYNGWSDDVIDDAFEGDPEMTWNID